MLVIAIVIPVFEKHKRCVVLGMMDVGCFEFEVDSNDLIVCTATCSGLLNPRSPHVQTAPAKGGKPQQPHQNVAGIQLPLNATYQQNQSRTAETSRKPPRGGPWSKNPPKFDAKGQRW